MSFSNTLHILEREDWLLDLEHIACQTGLPANPWETPFFISPALELQSFPSVSSDN